MKTIKYNKLIRDRIPKITAVAAKTFVVEETVGNNCIDKF